MKIKVLVLASMMFGMSLHASGPEAMCALNASGVFDTATDPGVVQGAADAAVETLLTANSTDSMCGCGLVGQAFELLQQGLAYAQATGNEYLGEYIQQGLALVQEHYEENPVATVAVGAVAVVTTVATTTYILRGCYRLMKRGFTACSRMCSTRKAKKKPARRHHKGIEGVVADSD